VLFFRAEKVLLSRTRDWPLLGAVPVLFIMTTLHLVGVIIRTYRGFISYDHGPTAYFELIHTHENTLAQAGQVGAILLTDILSVLRAYKLGLLERRFLQIAVLVVGLGTLVSAVLLITYGKDAQEGTNYFDHKISVSTLSFLATSTFTTALSTTLIASSLWKAHRDLAKKNATADRDSDADEDGTKRPPNIPYRCLLIFVESAALYSLAILLYLILFASKNVVEALFSTLAAPLGSITVSLIVLRLQHALPPSTPYASAQLDSFDRTQLRTYQSHRSVPVHGPLDM